MKPDVPHYLRFARALALLSGVASAGCSATVAGQDVPPGDTPPMIDAGISTSPDTPVFTGIDVAAPPPDAPDVQGPPPGIVPAPDVVDVAMPIRVDAGISVAPDASDIDVGGPQVAPEMPFA